MLSRWVQALLVVMGLVMLVLAMRGTISLAEDATCLRSPAAPPPLSLCSPDTCPAGWVCTSEADPPSYSCRQAAASGPSPPPATSVLSHRSTAEAPLGQRPPAAGEEDGDGFCGPFVKQLAGGGLTIGTSCPAKLQPYHNCRFLGAGHFGMGVRCDGSLGPVVIKLRYHERAGTIRNAVKEAVVGCQTALLRRAGAAETFVALHRFLWCNASSVTPFLQRIDLRDANTSIAETQAILKRMASTTSTITLVTLESVKVPDSLAHAYEGWVDAALLWEIFYSVLLCHHVLDYSVEDLRLHHLGWVDVDFHRQYIAPSGRTVTLPPGRMLKLIDVGSYRTRHFNFTAARGILSTAFYFTMFGKRDRIKQLDETAKVLFRWSCTPSVTSLSPLMALETFMQRLLELCPQYASAAPAGAAVRAYRVPSAQQALHISTTWADLRDYDWKRIPLTLKDAGQRHSLLPDDDVPA
eukprot:GGOE01019729.1.p1 GENE.GGOE01019729.1~~GGOE01019729.1.p1  ORF type:complete len:466 (+),score=108.44 GGOE01019729.1:117-1514(+)